MSVLYVENEREVRRFVCSFLAGRVGSLLEAGRADEALELFERHRPDVVVTDLQLPGMDGVRLAKALRRIDPDVPVVLTAAPSDPCRIQDAVEARFDGFVSKPVKIRTMLAALEEVADRRLHERSRRRVQAAMAQHYLAIEEEAMLLYIDGRGRLRKINERLLERLGYDPLLLLGEPFESLLYKDRRMGSRYRPLLKAIAAGESWHGEVHLISQSDMELIFKATLVPLFDTSRPDYRFMMLLEEVTELVNYRRILKNELDQTQRTLQEKVHFLTQYRNAINEGTAICRFLEDGTILRTDRRFDEIFGFDGEALTHRSFYRLCPNVADRLRRLVEESVRRGTILRKRIRCRREDGSGHVTDSVFIPIYKLDGNIEEIISIHNDITDIINLNDEIQTTQRELLYILGEVAESRSKETGHHVKRVAEYCRLLAQLAGLSESETELLAAAAPMHDVGKIAIPDEILMKEGSLTPEEFEVMKRHTTIGAELFSHSDRPFMRAARIVALEHHENYDGTGYPEGKRGEEIHIFGRIVALADVFDALSMGRCYKEPWADRKIVVHIREQRGRKFDPRLADLFLEHIDYFVDIRERIGR